MNPLDSAIQNSSYPPVPAPPASAWQGLPTLPQIQETAQVSVAASASDASLQAHAAPQLPHPASSGDESAEKLLTRHFAQALKNTGIKAEIQIEQGVGMIVRLVQSETGKVVMQLPPQGVIDLVAEIQQKQDQEMKIADPETAAPGETPGSTRNAEAVSTPSGGLIDALA